MPQSRKNNFRLQARYVLLTYSQCDGLDSAAVVQHIDSLGGKCVIGRENHADGGIHFHAFVDFGRQFSTRDAHFADVDDFHPNVQGGRRTPEKMYDYAIKDECVVHAGLERPQGKGDGKASKSAEKWGEIISAVSRDEFFERVAALDPRALCISYVSLCKYAEERYRRVELPYEAPAGLLWGGEQLPDLEEWVRRNVHDWEHGVR